VPVFISPRNRVAQLYPRTLGSLFVTSYDSQGLRWRYSNSPPHGLRSSIPEVEEDILYVVNETPGISVAHWTV
jgi:hypothetical protein